MNNSALIKKERLILYLFILPALIGYIIFVAYPVVNNIMLSFTDWNGITRTYNFIGLDNYKRLFEDERIRGAFINTLKYASIKTMLMNFLAVLLALGLTQRIRSANILRTTFFAPSIFSALIVGFLWKFIMAPFLGIFWVLFEKLGMDPINWLGDPSIVIYSIILIGVWQGTGWSAAIYIAGLQGIPESYMEAARIDGANAFQRFRYVTLPLLTPAITISLLNSLISDLKVFDLVMSTTQGGPGYSSEVMTTLLINMAFSGRRAGYASSLAVVFLLFILVVSAVLLKYMKKNEGRVQG
ncbi:MAG TPA: sugar ABC transporter permease [Clostridia bacterium]|nr:sugar ABC transporter permease [Clostridia bacterium]